MKLKVPLPKNSLSEIIKLNETFNLCDIWRVRNPNKKLFTFRQKHFTGIRQQRLDYIFVSNSLQESVKKQKWSIIRSFNRFLLLIMLYCNISLLFNTEFVKKLKIHIKIIKLHLQEKSCSDHSKWEFLKCEIG